MANHYYVYELVDPRDGAVFYVGKGKGRRIGQHVVDAKAGGLGNPFKSQMIRQILADGMRVVERKVAEGLSEAEAFKLERETIAKYRIANLTNITAGTETAAERARVLLGRVKPFDEWMAEQNTGLDGHPVDPLWYDIVVAGLIHESGLLEQVS